MSTRHPWGKLVPIRSSEFGIQEARLSSNCSTGNPQQRSSLKGRFPQTTKRSNNFGVAMAFKRARGSLGGLWLAVVLAACCSLAEMSQTLLVALVFLVIFVAWRSWRKIKPQISFHSRFHVILNLCVHHWCYGRFVGHALSTADVGFAADGRQWMFALPPNVGSAAANHALPRVGVASQLVQAEAGAPNPHFAWWLDFFERKNRNH